MKALVALSVVALAAAQYQPYIHPYAGYYGAFAPYFGLGYTAAPDATTYTNAPVNTYSAAPFTYAGPYATPYSVPALPSSQYHAQNELGGYSYGYAGPLSSKTENKNALGQTVGSYTYLDANNEVQTLSYTSDPVEGFKVTGTNLPVAPKADLKSPEFNLEAPQPVQDTAEVAAAKVEFAKKYAAAAAAAEAAPDTDAVDAAQSRRRRNAVLIPTISKATVRTTSLDKVEADTPADTTLLKLNQKEHEINVPSHAIAYTAPTFYSAPAFTYSVPHVKTVATPLTYSGFYPFGHPLYYTVAPKPAEAEEQVAVEAKERRRRSAVLIPTISKATVRTTSLDKVEADTPADTTLLKLNQKEHEINVPSHAIAYTAPTFYSAPAFTYSVPHVKTVATPLTYSSFYPFGHPLYYTIAPKPAEAEEQAAVEAAE